MTAALNPVTRRRFLQLSTAAACSIATSSKAAAFDGGALIDTHVYVGHWPLRRLSTETPAALVALLRRANVTQAWAGAFDGLFHKDVHGANLRLVDMCRQAGDKFLIPIGVVNPMLPDWEDDLRRCHASFKMPGVRLHPNYHGYTLEDPRFARLLELAAMRGLFVQLVARLHDQQHRHLTPSVSHVDLRPLNQIVPRTRDLRMLIASSVPAEEVPVPNKLPNAASIYFDFLQARDEKAIPKLANRVTADRIVYGSAAPLKNVTASTNLPPGVQFTAGQVQAIRSGNAQRLAR
jgi:predicted TIM-barrel fold metal-dependent hydrolase